ncbi:prolyl 4-hydroxylase subunit alpha-2-like isoform X2 [Scleropages formosus]|uniref:prolyl 4-hydroxylase subunit alpha-2-like isoform X2 n=1 Tax=Scleropages formosus TaxID=113540 RepID=UPI000878B3A8|nr:prolyl 4-hydroxylase subunit alpha-2-like isoform X2 [Scleropages formosus]
MAQTPLISSFFISIMTYAINAEFYSSMDHMTGLIFSKREFISSFKHYIRAEETHVDKLKSCLQVFEKISGEIPADPEKHISNPLTAYKFVRKLRSAWKTLEEVAQMSPSKGFLDALPEKSQHFPGDKDIDGVALGLLRLQETYRLNPERMRGGGLPKLRTLEPPDPDESFHIATMAHQKHKTLLAFLWGQDALKQLDEGKTAVVTKKEVLYFLSPLAFQMGELPLALQLTEELLKLDPYDFSVLHYLTYYQKVMQSVQRWNETQPTARLDTVMADENRNTYEALCRGEANGMQMTPRRQRALSCRYSTGGGNPRLLYGPIKEEDEWDHPQITRYHNFLSDKEIDTIKRLSRAKLRRAMVLDKETGQKLASEDRVSKSAWLSEEEDPVISRVNQRIADIVGLDMQTAEMLQLANDTEFVTVGGRIATTLIYMTDVEVGGATVFPILGAALKPQKGSAVFWYNLLKNGKEDDRTLHAACPVFVGSKWVANKWIRARGQEFRRPCALAEVD